jgi:hypothetical protein
MDPYKEKNKIQAMSMTFLRSIERKTRSNGFRNAVLRVEIN